MFGEARDDDRCSEPQHILTSGGMGLASKLCKKLFCLKLNAEL